MSAPARPKLTGERGSWEVTPFVRLARVHALSAASDACVAVALAGSLFFSIDPSAARSRVLLYLLFTMAPFALVGPLIGPALDRAKGGRRAMIMLIEGIRIGVVVLMMGNIDSLFLFPLAFASLVLGKSYAVAKAALVPVTVSSADELVEKNSRLAVLSAVSGFAGAAPAALLSLIVGSAAPLGLAAIGYGAALFAASKLPRIEVEDTGDDDDGSESDRPKGIALAASAMAVLRAIVGFMFFMVAFAFRGGTDDVEFPGVGSATGAAIRNAMGFTVDSVGGTPAWQLGLILGCTGIGSLAGSYLAPRLRQRLSEENMLLGALAAVLFVGVLAVWTGGLNGAGLLALVIGFASAGAKVAFDSLVQRDASDTAYGATFARFETRFQIAWVLGGVLPVLLKIPPRLGYFVISAAALFAAASFYLGSRSPSEPEIDLDAPSEQAAQVPVAAPPATPPRAESDDSLHPPDWVSRGSAAPPPSDDLRGADLWDQG